MSVADLNAALNRTILELKFSSMDPAMKSISALNRTILELKLCGKHL
jgi:hypothetical protein